MIDLNIAQRARYFLFHILLWPGVRQLYSPLDRFLPSPGHLCLDQTTGGHTEALCQEHRWVSWSFWSAPCSGDQDSDLRGNRRSSRPQWRRWGDSWNSRWMFSTVWCCSVSCLPEQKWLRHCRENQTGYRLTFIIKTVNPVDGSTLVVAS